MTTLSRSIGSRAQILISARSIAAADCSSRFSRARETLSTTSTGSEPPSSRSLPPHAQVWTGCYMQRFLTRLRPRTSPLVAPARTHARHAHIANKPFLGLAHLQRKMTDSDVDADVRHVNKKPRLGSKTPDVVAERKEVREEVVEVPEKPVRTEEQQPRPPPPAAALEPAEAGPSLFNALTSIIKKDVATRKQRQKQRKIQAKLPEPYSKEDIVWREIVRLLGQEEVDAIVAKEKDWESPLERFTEIEVTVSMLSSSGQCPRLNARRC